MAKFANVNQDTTTNSGAECMFQLQQVLVSAGWTVQMSSDGTTYKSTPGSQITQAGSGANGMNNTNAWYRIQDPGGTREWCVQRVASATQFRIKYSPLDKFTGGSPGATQVSAATDEQVLLGSGSNASPTGVTMFGTAGTYKNHIIAQSTAVGGVYGFWFFNCTNGSGAPASGALGCEPLAVGSYPVEDTDPCIIIASSTTGGFAGATTTMFGMYKQNLAGEAFVAFNLGQITGVAVLAGGSGFSGVNPYSGNDDMVAACFGRGSGQTQPGWKGWSNYLKLKMVNRSFPDTIALATDAYIYQDGCLLPWPDGVTPLT